LYKKSYKFMYIDSLIANMRDGGASSLFYISEGENYFIRKKYFGLIPASFIYFKKLLKRMTRLTLIRLVGKTNWMKIRYKD